MKAHRRVRFLIGIDTEPDNVWADYRSTSLRNVLGLHRFHRLAVDLGIRPTYLVTHSVAADAGCVEALQHLRAIGPCEIGAHLHAWETPPYRPDGTDRACAFFAHDLTADEFGEKMTALTEQIARNFPPPRSYRAGRFGFAPEHIRVLESLGYRVDSSVVPLFDRGGKFGLPKSRGGKGGRDYRLAPLEPYHPDYLDDLRPGSARLLEVPVSVSPHRPVSNPIMAAHRRGPRWLQRALSKSRISRVIHASPSEVPWEALEGLLSTMLATGRQVFNGIVHSSETLAGGAPWIAAESHVQELLDRIRRCVEWLEARASVEFLTYSELAERNDDAVGALPLMRMSGSCV